MRVHREGESTSHSEKKESLAKSKFNQYLSHGSAKETTNQDEVKEEAKRREVVMVQNKEGAV